MSRIVASGVDFLAGITAAADGLLAGVALGLLLAEGDDDFVGEVDGAGFGVGEMVFSVVTETLGSPLFSDAVAAGDGLSSWANANGTAAAHRAVTARTAIFICFSFWTFAGVPSLGSPYQFEGRIVGGGRKKRQGPNSLARPTGRDRASRLDGQC